MLKYWNQTLENISKDQRNEKFKLIVNNRTKTGFFQHKVAKIEIPLSLAIGISPLISDEYFKDPSFHKLNITINCNNKEANNQLMCDQDIQEELNKFFKGEKISSDMFYEIGIQLKNKDMIKKWSKS